MTDDIATAIDKVLAKAAADAVVPILREVPRATTTVYVHDEPADWLARERIRLDAEIGRHSCGLFDSGFTCPHGFRRGR